MTDNKQYPAVTECVRAAGGRVHSDGNIFFKNADAFLAASSAMRAAQPYDHGPQATTLAEAARDVGKWLNERPNRPLDLRHVAMLCTHAQAPQPVEPAVSQGEPQFDLSTSKGGRGYVAWFFGNRLLPRPRHDFDDYCKNVLAADFACVLARHLAAQPQEAAPLSTTFVQTVPDKCDRIVWRNGYYHLPLAAPSQDAEDAARMAWLCDESNIYWISIQVEPDRREVFNSSLVYKLRAAIDAARTQAKEGKP